MAGLGDFQIPPPAKWEDFESLCLDLWRRIWHDDKAQRNGRRGQPQSGVDIFGRPNGGRDWAGVQCKCKDETLNSVLSEKELSEEVEKAKTFKPPLSSFTVACTGARNAAVQERARLLTAAHDQAGLFSVHVFYWADILERLNDFPDVATIHLPHFRPMQALLAAERRAEVTTAGIGTAAIDDNPTLISFAQPSPRRAMLERQQLTNRLRSIIGECSVYLSAPSGYGKSIVLGQLRIPNTAWLDCKDELREFGRFRNHLGRFMRVKYALGTSPENPRDFALALDDCIANSMDRNLLLAIDHVDGVDNGVKVFLEELASRAMNVKFILTGSTLRFKRQTALESSGHMRVITAAQLAFTEIETVAVITSPLRSTGASPSAEFAVFAHQITGGWPIAIQLVRERLEREPDESAVARSLRNLGKQELRSYLLESYWSTLEPKFKDLLISTTIYKLFDRSDAQALPSVAVDDSVWGELEALPFVVHHPDNLRRYHLLFGTFLVERLARERTPDQVRHMHYLAGVHFLEEKSMPPAAHYHAQRSEDPSLILRATAEMAEFLFMTGSYGRMREVLDEIPPPERWNDTTLSVYQGRFYEHVNDLSNALKWYKRAQVLAEQHGPEYWRVGIVNDIAGILRQMGRPDEAIALYDAALGELQSEEPSQERAKFLANRGNALLAQGRYTEAEREYARAKAIFALHRDKRSLGLVYQGFADLARRRRDPKRASAAGLKALSLFRRAKAADLYVSVAEQLGSELLAQGRYKLVHRLYAEALAISTEFDVPAALPFLMNNFGVACAFLPEPDPKGTQMLITALELKRASGMRRGGTLQNLTLLLMRLGEFERAIPFVHEQLEFAEQTGDHDLAVDGRIKKAALESFLNGSSRGVFADAENGLSSGGLGRAMLEGRVRSALRRRCPSLRDAVAQAGDAIYAVKLGGRTFEIRDAETIIFLMPAAGSSASEAHNKTAGLEDAEENYILELISERKDLGQLESAGNEHPVVAIWYVRKGDLVWMQAFRERRGPHDASLIPVDESDECVCSPDDELSAADEPEARESGHPPACHACRHTAEALLHRYYVTDGRIDIVLSGRKCPIVMFPAD